MTATPPRHPLRERNCAADSEARNRTTSTHPGTPTAAECTPRRGRRLSGSSPSAAGDLPSRVADEDADGPGAAGAGHPGAAEAPPDRATAVEFLRGPAGYPWLNVINSKWLLDISVQELAEEHEKQLMRKQRPAHDPSVPGNFQRCLRFGLMMPLLSASLVLVVWYAHLPAMAALALFVFLTDQFDATTSASPANTRAADDRAAWAVVEAARREHFWETLVSRVDPADLPRLAEALQQRDASGEPLLSRVDPADLPRLAEALQFYDACGELDPADLSCLAAALQHRGASGEPVIFVAARLGLVDCVAFIHKRCDQIVGPGDRAEAHRRFGLLAVNNLGISAFFAAAEAGHCNVLEYAVKAFGADVLRTTVRNGLNLAHVAVLHQQPAVLKALAASGFSCLFTQRTSDGAFDVGTPASLAARTGCPELLRFILEHIDCNFAKGDRDADGFSYAHRAAINNNVAALEVLGDYLGEEFVLSPGTASEVSAFDIALMLAHSDVVEHMLQRYPAMPRDRAREVRTAKRHEPLLQHRLLRLLAHGTDG